MQFLDPKLKGIKAAGCLLMDRSGRNLSGSNSLTSEPHSSTERCTAKAPTTAPTPAGIITLLWAKDKNISLIYYEVSLSFKN